MEGRHIAGTAIGTVIKVVIAAVIILYVYRFSMIAYDYGFRIFGEPPVAEAPGESVTVAILDNAGVKEIGVMLEQKGLIRDAELFYWQEKVSAYAGQIKPGTYELNTSMTVEEMMEVMSLGHRAGAEKAEETEIGQETGDTGEPEEETQEESQP